MATIVAAAESQVQVGKDPVEGVQSIEYRTVRSRSNVYGIGSTERLDVVAGPSSVEVCLTVASTSPRLNAIGPDERFDLTAALSHGGSTIEVGFHECVLEEKNFAISVGGVGVTVYRFTAARVDEKPPATAAK
jgi:hypothetical protein